MKIVLNAYNLKVGGGLNVAFNFMQQLQRYPNDKFYAFVPAGCGYEKLALSNLTIIPVPSQFQKYAMRYFLEHVWLPGRIKKIDPDVIFSMGNFPLPIQGKQALLFHYPYLIYDFAKHVKLSAKEKMVLFFQKRVFKARLKHINKIFPQTNVAGQRLKNKFGKNLNLQPVPNAYSKLKTDAPGTTLFERTPGLKYLLCLTKYYPHKNVEVLLEVSKLLREHNGDIRIITTIGEEQHANAKVFLDQIKSNQLEEYLINIGPVGLYDIPQLYSDTDGLILPTYMESFTATYVDAMFFQKPVFTSNLDFAQEICGDAAYYFDPSEPEDIYRVINEAFLYPEIMDQKIEEGTRRSENFPDWEQVADMYIQGLKNL